MRGKAWLWGRGYSWGRVLGVLCGNVCRWDWEKVGACTC